MRRAALVISVVALLAVSAGAQTDTPAPTSTPTPTPTVTQTPTNTPTSTRVAPPTPNCQVRRANWEAQSVSQAYRAISSADTYELVRSTGATYLKAMTVCAAGADTLTISDDATDAVIDVYVFAAAGCLTRQYTAPRCSTGTVTAIRTGSVAFSVLVDFWR